MVASLLLTCLNGIVHAGEVITEIRFRENGVIALPVENCLILIDLKGEERRIEVKQGDLFVISDFARYRGLKQYSTEEGDRVYKRVKIAGDHYHWFYVSDPSSRSQIEDAISKMMQAGG